MGANRVALVFPGQGAQRPAMGASLIAEGREPQLLRVAAGAGLDLAGLLVTGSAADLLPTEVAQPALYYCGVALGRLLLEAGLHPLCAAGHSLGEYCALTVAGALDGEQGMALVLQRAAAMATAPDGTMAAVLGLEADTVHEICAQISAGGECCVVANDNCPGQLVISGSRAGVGAAAALAKDAGAGRVIPLSVAGAFHSPLMRAAAQRFAAHIEGAEIRDPAFPVVLGGQGRLVSSGEEIRRALLVQLESPVLWSASVRAMVVAGVRRFFECGPGTTLASLIRKIEPDIGATSVASPDQAAAALDGLRAIP